MATVDMSPGVTTLHPTRSGNTSLPYLVEVSVDFAAAAVVKGSALAAADVIECIDVPAGTLILNAGLEVTTAAAGESADNAWDLGITGVDADVFVDGFDGDAAAAGDYAQNAAAFQPIVIGAATDTIDLLIQAATTAPTSGVVRVWAVLMDISGRNAPGIVALGS
jgi:hypothetical protein